MRNAIFQRRPKEKLTAAFFSAVVLAISIAAAMFGWRHYPTPQTAANLTLKGEAAIEKLKADGSYNSLADGIAAARYQINHQVNQQGNKWLADNPAQKFNASFTGEELRITDFGLQNDKRQSTQQQWEFGLKLNGFGYSNDFSELGQGELTSNGNRIEISKPATRNPQSAITEWYVNKPEGLEQGFTLNSRPARYATRSGSDWVQLSLQVTGNLQAEVTDNRQAVVLKNSAGHSVLSYDKLAAWDADGKQLPATMSVNGNKITLEVDDREARYPVTIDPLISQQQKWLAADGAGGDAFGTSIAISGNFAIVGAWGDDSDKGSAYVFLRGASGFWSQQAKLTANDGAAGDNFGRSVSISGNTAVIGAWRDNLGNNQFQGSAYVFTYNNPSWTQQAKLLDNNGGAFDQFGQSVSISGNTLVVGAHQHNTNGVSDQGAAYVYFRSGNTWTLQQKLIAADGATGDNFGQAVAINGNTIAVTASSDDVSGISDQGSVYVFIRSGAVWTQQQKLVAADGQASDRLGASIAMSSDTIVVGAANDDIGANGDQGSAYVFTRSGATWSQQQKLTANDGAANDYFGISVALYGQIVVVGAEGDDTGANGDQGAAYVFSRNGASWTQQNKLTAADGAQGDNFGNAVAVEGDAVLTGAYLSGGTDRGAAYFYSICGDIGPVQKIFKIGVSSREDFGSSIAANETTAVIGAPAWNVGQGAAYVFTKTAANTWIQTQTLTASNGNSADDFGSSVAIDGDTIVIGAPSDNFSGGSFTFHGSIYVFVRNGGTWTQKVNLSGNDVQDYFHFGSSVAISGNTMVVGTPNAKIGVSLDRGAAYIFSKNGIGDWVQVQKLLASDGATDDRFGYPVAINGGNIFVGAGGKNAVYHFKDNISLWGQAQKLTASGGIAFDGTTLLIGDRIYTFNGNSWASQQQLTVAGASSSYGRAVAVSDDLAVIGDNYVDVGGNAHQGAAYLFKRDQGVWTQQKKLIATDGAADDRLGWSVALSGEQVLAGAAYDTIAGVDNAGSVYVFGCTSCPAMSISPSTLPAGAVGNAYNLTLTASGGSAPYQFSVSNGSLPPGLTLAQSGQISGFAGASGSFTFTVTVMTQNLCTDSRTYTMTINGSCSSFSLNPVTLPNGTVNTVYSQTLLPTGGTAPFTFSFTGTLPAGVSLNTQTGVLSGLPTTAGGFNFGITATDSNGCQGGKAYTVTINSVGGVSATDLQFYPLAHPVRLLDTRVGFTGCDSPAAKIAGGTSRTQTAAGRTCDGLSIPANAAALVGNATSVQSGGGYFTLYPSDIAKPNSANSNFAANQILNSLFTVRLGANDGAFKIFVSTDTDIVVDITGYYAPPSGSGLYFHPLPKPVRLLDTRPGASACFTPGAALQGDTVRTQLGTTTCDNVLIPAGAQALTGNATTVSPQANGFLTLYPADAARPLIASANFQPGVNLNSPFMVGMSPSGEFNIYVASTTDLVVDVTGYYSTQLNDSNGQGLLFNALSGPVRLLDTRAGQTGCYTPGTPMTGGTPYTQAVIGACSNVPAAAQAVVGNATTVNATANGYLTFWPSDANQPFIATSNYRTGITFNRHFTVGLGNDGAFKRYAASTTDLVVDLIGYFAP